MAQELMPFEQINQMAIAFTQSGFFGYRNPSEALTLMLLANANGLHPVKAAERYHIIQGRPAMKADAMLATFQEAGGQIKWLKRSADECKLWLAHPQAGELEVSWTIQRAKDAGLTSKNTWKQFPIQMLSARCVSEGVRALYPACLCGLYTPEEVTDFDTKPQTITPPPTAPTITTEPQKQQKKEEKVIDAEVVTEPPPKQKKSAKEAFCDKMAELKAKHPEAFAKKLELMKIEDYTLLPSTEFRPVYNAVRQHIDDVLEYEASQAQEDINDVQLFD